MDDSDQMQYSRRIGSLLFGLKVTSAVQVKPLQRNATVSATNNPAISVPRFISSFIVSYMSANPGGQGGVGGAARNTLIALRLQRRAALTRLL